MVDTPFHGIDFKTMAGLSDNMMYILGPSQIAAIDTTSGVSAILPYEDVHAGFARFIGEEVIKPDRAKTVNYSVAQHTHTMTNLCREIDMSSPGIHDQLEQQEARLRARMNLVQEEMMRDMLSGTTTQSAESRLPYSLDELEADLDRLAEEKFESDKKLIEALVAAGVDVVQGGHSGRPVVTLSADMNSARTAVVTERANRDRQENHYRDTLGYWGGRLDMRP